MRRPFIEMVEVSDGENSEPRQVMRIRGVGFRHFAGTLLSCHWCTGMWCAIAIVLVYLYLPAGFPALIILAIA